MDDIVLCNKSNEVPRCFKHNTSWQSRVQEIFNKLRDKHIKRVYMNRFNKLLCSCKGLEYANLWEDVTDEQFYLAVKFLDDYVASNTAGELFSLLSTVMQRLRYDDELYDIGYDSPEPGPYPRSSALRLCYLLQKVVEKDFEIMEPKKPKGVAQAAKKQKEEKSLTISLDGIEASFIPHLIGEGGRTILIFMKRERCRVEIVKVGEQHVTATIKKSILPGNMGKLQEIGEKLKEYVKETKDTYDNDAAVALERMDVDHENNEAEESGSVGAGNTDGSVADNSVSTMDTEQPITKKMKVHQ